MSLIAIDCRFAALHAGLGRYTRSLVRELVSSERAEYVLLVRSRDEEWIPAGVRTVEMDIPHYSLREQTLLPRMIKSLKCDVFFSPHFNVPLFCPVPFVVTIHDLILHRYPNRASVMKQLGYRLQIGHAIRSAESVIAVSGFTKTEIADVYGRAAEAKTHIVPEAADGQYRPAVEADIARFRSRMKLEKPYFVYVGNAKQHKNVDMLISAFVKASLDNTELILVSGGPEFERLRPLPPGVRQISGVADEDLSALYSGAISFVTASLYEGFCLPAVEALACACPVIASDRTAMAEIFRGHALLVEPAVDAFADALQRPPARRDRVIIGTWKAAARSTEEILFDAAHRKKASH